MGQKVAARIVFDTNTVISALFFQNGRLSWLREIWSSGYAIPIVSRQTSEELLRVFSYPKFKLTKEDQAELLGDYLPFAEIVEIDPSHLPELPQCRDLHDQMFIELAVVAEVDALITGDEDLLSLKNQLSISIFTPTEWQHTLSDR